MSAKLYLRIDTAHLTLHALGQTTFGRDAIVPKPLTVLFKGESAADVKERLVEFLSHLSVQKYDAKQGSAWVLSNFLNVTRQLFSSCDGLPELFLAQDDLKLVVSLPEPDARITIE